MNERTALVTGANEGIGWTAWMCWSTTPAEDGVKVNALAPGLRATDLNSRAAAARR